MKYFSVFWICISLMIGQTEAEKSGMHQTEMTAGYILEKVDANAVARNRRVDATMIIHGRRMSRTISIRSWVEGDSKSFSEYLAPPREAGTRMLKLDDQLWTYSPQADRIIKIAGHMLRQSLNGSDISYEDMLEDTRLSSSYDAEIAGTDTLIGRPCHVLFLSSVTDDVSYPSRRIWIDKEYYIVLQEERYARSGMLLKTTVIEEIFQVDERWYPKKIIFRDALKSGKGTEFIIDSIAFDIDIPEYLFSKASLK